MKTNKLILEILNCDNLEGMDTAILNWNCFDLIVNHTNCYGYSRQSRNMKPTCLCSLRQDISYDEKICPRVLLLEIKHVESHGINPIVAIFSTNTTKKERIEQ